MKQPKYIVEKDRAGEWRWTFKAANGEPIGMSSEGYTECRSCLNGLQLLRCDTDVKVIIIR